jgi:hypothetical protein
MVRLASESMCASPKSVIQSLGGIRTSPGLCPGFLIRQATLVIQPPGVAGGYGARFDHQIRRLDVAVDDAELVCVVERFGGLNAELGDATVEIFGPLGAERGKGGGDGVGQSCRWSVVGGQISTAGRASSGTQ